ncbi:PAS domain S-box protein [Belnapia sp. F-4-1]|uniref:PAS domain-containing sensor histidine kinase n=1 Tax=Belnapia sp. F-4-1 TaxID=1545443 RepID=UPI0006920844|nr:PAS domain S-box protein [Belnapia sp. F-4-1]
MDAEAQPGFLAGGGEMGARMRAFDWFRTSLGPVEGWSGCLRTAASLVLALPFANVLLWGSDLTVAAYNDAYRERLGEKPEALGRSILEVWPEVRETIAPQLRLAMSGETVSFKDVRFTLTRSGVPEEAWFDYSFSPIRDETGNVAGILNTAIETTGRVLAEAARRESETRWRDVFDHMGEGFEIIEVIRAPDGRTVDFRYVDINAAWERHTGFPRAMIVGKRATEIFPPEETPFWIEAFGRVVETGEPTHIERYFPPANRWLELIVYRLGPGQAAVLLRNVTERHEAAKRLRASTERQQIALETGLIGFFEWDVVAGVVTADEHFARLYGIHLDAAAAGVTLAPLFDHIHPSDRHAVEAHVAGALASCSDYETGFRLILPDGATRWLLARGRCAERQGRQASRYIGTVVDVTEAKVAEAALRDSEERLRLILEGIHDYAIFTTDPDHRIDAWMPGAAHVFGWSAEEVLGQPAAVLFTPEDREAGVPDREMATARREGMCPNVGWHLRKDGQRVFIEGSVTALRGPDDRIRGFLKIGQDVTARKAAEERQALLMREVDHRAKNALSVVGAALRLTRALDLPSYIKAIEGRISALARAQTMLANDHWIGADLRTLLRGELAAFFEVGAAGGPQAEASGPTVALPARAAQPFAMAIHELATNAIKYGGLSTPTGRIAITWEKEGWPTEVLRFRWAESGGPLLEGNPERRGFGTRVLDGTVRRQLGGTVSLAWETSGLVCEIEVPLLPIPKMVKLAIEP